MPFVEQNRFLLKSPYDNKFQVNEFEFEIPDVSVFAALLSQKKDRLKGEHNVVNYLAWVAKAAAEFDPVTFQVRLNFDSPGSRAGFAEVIDNLVAMAAEHPLAEATRHESRTETWDIQNTQWRLRGRFGYLDEMLSEARQSTQTQPFEINRFAANEENYSKLRKGRTLGNTQVFVEFSPSPIITREAKLRSYQGRSCIFFFRFERARQTETVEQRWLKAEWSDFENLLKSLGKEIPIQMNDAEVMGQSNFFDTHDISKIEQFIETHDGARVYMPRLASFIEGELRQLIERELSHHLKVGANNLLTGQAIDKEVYEIITTLKYAQFRLRSFINDLTGIRMTRLVIDPVDLSPYDHDPRLRREFVEREKLPLAGCGSASGSTEVGNETSLGGLLLAEDRYGSRQFECPHCHKIVVRPHNELIPKCPECGGNVRC